MARMRKHAPKWVRRHVQVCRAAFGIGGADFLFYLRQSDTVDGDPDVAGVTDTAARYERATVTLHRGLAPDAMGYEIVTHEVLHAAMGAQRQAVSRIIELVPEALRDHAEELWQDGNEATVTRLGRSLSRGLRAPGTRTSGAGT